MAGFPAAIGSVRPGLLPQVAAADIDAACNWKLFVENHIDVYHLWYLHALSLADFEHRRFEHRAVGPHWVSYEPRRDADGPTGLDGGNPPIAHLDERDRNGLGAHLLFPNMTMAVSAEFVITYAAVPVAPDRCRIELRVRAEPGADADGLLAAARSFIDEDIAACERIQAALASPWFEVGPLARDHEAPITAFQRHVLAALLTTRRPATGGPMAALDLTTGRVALIVVDIQAGATNGESALDHVGQHEAVPKAVEVLHAARGARTAGRPLQGGPPQGDGRLRARARRRRAGALPRDVAGHRLPPRHLSRSTASSRCRSGATRASSPPTSTCCSAA